MLINKLAQYKTAYTEHPGLTSTPFCLLYLLISWSCALGPCPWRMTSRSAVGRCVCRFGAHVEVRRQLLAEVVIVLLMGPRKLRSKWHQVHYSLSWLGWLCFPLHLWYKVSHQSEILPVGQAGWPSGSRDLPVSAFSRWSWVHHRASCFFFFIGFWGFPSGHLHFTYWAISSAAGQLLFKLYFICIDVLFAYMSANHCVPVEV